MRLEVRRDDETRLAPQPTPSSLRTQVSSLCTLRRLSSQAGRRTGRARGCRSGETGGRPTATWARFHPAAARRRASRARQSRAPADRGSIGIPSLTASIVCPSINTAPLGSIGDLARPTLPTKPRNCRRSSLSGNTSSDVGKWGNKRRPIAVSGSQRNAIANTTGTATTATARNPNPSPSRRDKTPARFRPLAKRRTRSRSTHRSAGKPPSTPGQAPAQQQSGPIKDGSMETD